jgi:hypothetical protein
MFKTLPDVASVAFVVVTWNETKRAKQINLYLYSCDFIYQIELRNLRRFILT